MLSVRRASSIVSASVAAALTFSLISATGSVAEAADFQPGGDRPAPLEAADLSALDESSVDMDEEGLQEGFEFIEGIPDSALQSQQAFDRWAEENHGSTDDPEVDALLGSDSRSASGPVSCGIAITAAVVSNVFAVSKILKVNKIIKAAGGATKFAKKAISEFKEAKRVGFSNKEALEYAADEAAKESGKAAAAALLDIFSVNAVLKDCFGVNI